MVRQVSQSYAQRLTPGTLTSLPVSVSVRRTDNNFSYLAVDLTHTIGADSMGAIAPTAKKLWGRRPQVAPTGILLCRVFETVNWVNFCTCLIAVVQCRPTQPKYTEKNYECVKKVRWLQSENAPKAFGGRAPPGLAGGACSAPPDP